MNGQPNNLPLQETNSKEEKAQVQQREMTYGRKEKTLEKRIHN